MLVITDEVQFQLFFESRKGFGYPNSCRKTVPSTWTSDQKGLIAHFSLGSRHEKVVRIQLSSYSIETFTSTKSKSMPLN